MSSLFSIVFKASSKLEKLHKKHLVYKYCSQITPERKKQMEEKVIAEELFKDKKANYYQSISKLFVNNRLCK